MPFPLWLWLSQISPMAARALNTFLMGFWQAVHSPPHPPCHLLPHLLICLSRETFPNGMILTVFPPSLALKTSPWHQFACQIKTKLLWCTAKPCRVWSLFRLLWYHVPPCSPNRMILAFSPVLSTALPRRGSGPAMPSALRVFLSLFCC